MNHAKICFSFPNGHNGPSSGMFCAVQGSVRRWCVRVKAKQADRFIATQLNLLNQAFQLAATAKTTNTWKGIQVWLLVS